MIQFSQDTIPFLTVNLLFLTAILSLVSFIINSFSFKENKKDNRLKLFTNLIKEHREVRKIIYDYEKSKDIHKIAHIHETIFCFYDYLSSLILNEEIDLNLFYSFFEWRFESCYILFKNSLFWKKNEKEKYFPNLVMFFHLLGLDKNKNEAK